MLRSFTSRLGARCLSRIAIPYFVLLGTLLLTVIAILSVETTARARDQLQFDNATQRTLKDIQDRINTCIALLRAGNGLFAATDRVSLNEFRIYVSQLSLRQQYPGLQGIGFSRRVTPSQVEDLVQTMRRQGVQNFYIRPPYVRQEYHTIVYLEPLDRRNQAAIGFDMFTEPIRRVAMERARDSGRPAMSGRVTLVQEIDPNKQAGFLLYLPIYEGALTPPTIAQRQANLRGFVYIPFRADDFIQGIFGEPQGELVNFQIYDGLEPRPEYLLHDSRHKDRFKNLSYQPRFHTVRKIEIAGHPWTITFSSRPDLDSNSERRLVPFVALIGGLISLILFGITRSQVRAYIALEQAATELREAEQARLLLLQSEQLARTEAETANRLKDEFLATLSHELRSPLNAVLGWVHLLQTRQLDPTTIHRALETIERNAKAQAQLVEDLLDVSRIIRGQLRLNIRPVSLPAVITTALETVRPAAEAKRIQLQTVLDRQMGLVAGDLDRLQQVVWNLLSNAIKFTPEGGQVAVRLSLVMGSATREAQCLPNQKTSDPKMISGQARYAQLEICDTGKGISPEFLPYVFDRFRQADSSITRSYGGLGLGLAIVRQLVELHGGTIQARSEGEGKGATFMVTLPLIAVEQQSHLRRTVPEREASRLNSSSELAALRILLVDDEIDARQLMVQMLQTHGLEVVAVGSAEEAIWTVTALHQSSPFDVLISDIGMPDQDGYTLMGRIRTLKPEQGGGIPAIALTAYAGADNQQRSLQAGFQIHLNKPVNLAELLAAITTLSGL
ncbi:hypothetical protein BST81_22610 [Leptolyngbya sp. 'hensonii']|nr:hypothetical protein BST81_22610 [Leptolyngbya sp. 'hensonii']